MQPFLLMLVTHHDPSNRHLLAPLRAVIGMGSLQTSRHSLSYSPRLGPYHSLVSEDCCSSFLQTSCQRLQSFHRDIYCSGSVEGCLHSPGIQSLFPPLSCRFLTHIHYAGFIKNLGKIVLGRFLNPSFTCPPPTLNFSDQYAF